MEHLVDCRGLKCPLPALVLAREVRARGAGVYRVRASDPAADVDIPDLCAERGWTCRVLGSGRFLVTVGPEAEA